ncbi:hypothetical protein ANANG_G00310620 [Anguilla anguilla]|uniref:Uncharacterized protein n=1 Tax=Anguilla anguilla TaxID=7936 RepID=A0A9D3LPP0_ANGAN|nr:hypothetical protein ANANG_G00310620 [Anguilla anguilla]
MCCTTTVLDRKLVCRSRKSPNGGTVEIKKLTPQKWKRERRNRGSNPQPQHSNPMSMPPHHHHVRVLSW